MREALRPGDRWSLNRGHYLRMGILMDYRSDTPNDDMSYRATAIDKLHSIAFKEEEFKVTPEWAARILSLPVLN